MNPNLVALLYLAAGVLFIMALRGLSSPESSRRGNQYGMIGDGTTDVSSLPKSIAVDIVAVSAGKYHTCAIDQSSSLFCWGHGNSGQLGDGTQVDHLSPTVVSTLTGVAEVDLGGHDLARIGRAARCVVSPGVPPEGPSLMAARLVKVGRWSA